VEYLLAAMKSARRRMQFEQLLLLIVRVLIIVLVVTAVAEPFFERGGFAFVAGERTHRVLVIDGSYSMAYRPTDQSRFDRAKELAARIVDESTQGDGFSLVLAAEPPRVIVGGPVFEPGDFLREVDGLRLVHGSLDLPMTMARVEEILSTARREQPRLTREEVFVITDLGRVGWSAEESQSTAWNELRDRCRRMAESAALVVIDLGQTGAENLAVTELRSSERLVTTAQDVVLDATLQSFGRPARERVPLELVVDGRRIQQEHVDVTAGGEAAVAFSYRFETPGDHALEVRLEGDSLEVDNSRWLALPVRQAVDVLVVDGRPSGRTFGGAADYLVHALAPGDVPGAAAVRPEVIPESRLLERSLDRYACVVVSNVAQFTSSEARVLEAYLKTGGSLIFFLGDRVMPERYNRELAGTSDGAVRILPARLGPVVDEPQFRLDPREYRHPIVREFRGHERAGLLTTPVGKHYKLLLPEKSKARVALALADGDPLVVEEPVHRGRVVLVGTSADPSWTLLPKWPSFVPLVRESLAFAVGEETAQRNLEVGEPLGGSLAASAGDVPLAVRTPDGRSETVPVRAEADGQSWGFSDTDTSGIYTARFGPPVSRTELYAVNVDPAESDLAKLSEEELREDVWPGVPFVHQTSWEDPADEPVARIGRPSKLPKGLLYGVLVLLFAETFLARRFGNPPV
jgi:hypothetical protein